MALLFLPVAFGVHDLYQWARPEAGRRRRDPAAQGAVPEHPVLLRPRASSISCIWCGLALLPDRLVAPSRTRAGGRRARAGDAAAERRRPPALRAHAHLRVGRLADVARPALVLDDLRDAASSAARASRRWRSPSPCMVLLSRSEPFAQRREAATHLHDLGKLLLAFVMLWAYFSFSQFLIIWSANLPEEIPWYLTPDRGRLAVVRRCCWSSSTSCCRSCCCCRATSSARRAAGARGAAASSCMRFVDLFWLMGPARRARRDFGAHWMDFAAPLAVGGHLGWRSSCGSWDRGRCCRSAIRTWPKCSRRQTDTDMSEHHDAPADGSPDTNRATSSRPAGTLR